MPRPSFARDAPTEETVPESVSVCSGLWTVNVCAPAANVPAPERVMLLVESRPTREKPPATA